MKPSSWNKQLGWSRCWNAQRDEGGQDQNPSWQQTGLDASYHICVSLEVRGEVFLLTSPFIGLLTPATRLAHGGTLAGLCAGSQPGGDAVGKYQRTGTGQPLCRRPGGTGRGGPQWHGASRRF